LGVAGSYAVLGEVRGTTAIPRAHLDIALTGVRQGDTSLGDGRLYVRLTDRQDPWVREARDWDGVPPGEPCGRARAGFANGRWRPSRPLRTGEGLVPAHEVPMAYLVCGEALGGAVGIDLTFGWTDVYPVRGEVTLDDLDLGRFLESSGGERFGGAVDGRLLLTGGALEEPEKLEGELRLDRVRLAASNERGETQVALTNDAPVTLSLTEGGFLVESARLRGDGAELRFEGGGSATGDLALRVAGDVDLGLLARVSDDVSRSGGALGFRVSLTGKVDDPAVFGDVFIRDGSGRIAGVPAALENVEGALTFSERRILVERLDAELAGGALEIRGGASIAEGSLERYDFEASLRNATLTPEDGVLVALSADTNLAWQRGERLPRLSGEVELRRARYERRIDLSPTLGQLYRPQRAEVERYDPAADNVELDLRVTDRSPMRITNNLFDLDLRIDDAERPFRIVGTDQRYGILGNIRIPRGTVRFRGSDFDVTSGDVRFDDASRVDPRFVVVAQTEIRRQQTAQDLTAVVWQIRLRAEGGMDGFRLDASSNPQLSQEDLALLLTVGLTSAEAQQLQAGDVGGTALEAISALTGVNDEVRAAVQVIDEFAITTRYSPDTGRPEPMVTVGKRLTDRVRVSASTGLTGEDRTFTTGVEWRLDDQSSVQVSYDNINRESNSRVGNIGVDFHWRLEFE
ncbi:MAG: translocation/assembly module TamB domain-containing protein, partial [Myxococcota bacterium]